MSFRNIKPALMAAISERWRDPMRDRPVLEKLPVVRALLPVIDRVHQDLVRKQRLLSSIIAEIKRIQEQLSTADGRHDSKMRAAYQILTGFAEAAQDPETAAAILSLRDKLFPNGLLATTRSYLEEAGDARLVWGRLNEKDVELLHALPIPGGTLADLVNGWIQDALELEALEQRRAELSRQRGSESDVMSPAQARSAANAWIRMARALETNMAIDPAVTDEIKERILGPLYQAEAVGDRRQTSETAEGEEAAEGEDTGSGAGGPADNDGADTSTADAAGRKQRGHQTHASE